MTNKFLMQIGSQQQMQSGDEEKIKNLVEKMNQGQQELLKSMTAEQKKEYFDSLPKNSEKGVNFNYTVNPSQTPDSNSRNF